MKFKYLTMAVAIGATLGLSPILRAAELPAGTVIDKSNLDRVKNDTFEGKTIGSMLTERLEWQIRNHDLKLTLQNSKPLPVDPKRIEATKKYSADVKYDPAKNEVSNYKAGTPFPDIAENDPHKAAKLIWNFYYGSPVGHVMDFPKFEFLLIDGKSGLERTQRWSLYRYFHKGRLDGGPAVYDNKIYTRTLLFASYPNDIKGIGTFTISHDGPQVEDVWV